MVLLNILSKFKKKTKQFFRKMLIINCIFNGTVNDGCPEGIGATGILLRCEIVNVVTNSDQ